MDLRLPAWYASFPAGAGLLAQSIESQVLQFAADLVVAILILILVGILYYAVRQVQRRTIDVKDQTKLANVFAQYVLITLILGVPILSVWLILNLVTTTSPSSLANLSGQATATALAAPGTATGQAQAATASARPPTATGVAPGSMTNANPTAAVAAATTGASAATTGASAATTAANASALGAVVPTPVPVIATAPTNAPIGTVTPATMTATVVPVDGVFGPLDNGVEPYRRYLIAAFITLVTSLIEIFLILTYGAYFVNDPNTANQPLGLPPAAVRVFLIVVIVFVILLFTLLPDSWGSNKTTVLLIGLLTTVVGFYFGSKQSADTETTAAASPTRTLTLRFDNATIPLAARARVRARIVEDVTPLFQTRQPLIMVSLLQNSGDPLPNSRVTAALGRNDKAVEFNFAAVPFPSVETSYIVDVLAPPNLECGDRLTFQV